MLFNNDYEETFIYYSKYDVKYQYCHFLIFLQNHAKNLKKNYDLKKYQVFYCDFLILYFNQLYELGISVLKILIPKRTYALIQH